jgi:GT2 family glycosyltransferase
MSTRIRVAVCTNRGPEAVRECAAALRAQLGGERLALVTSGLPAVEAERHRESFGSEVLVEPRPGLSRARNRALAWTPDDEVLAFVDDDAVVAEGWWEALRRRWDEAPAEVACIGGPIRPRFAQPPPPWFSEAIAPALTVLDRGPEARDLDPAAESVYGANISFRAAPLRQAGGFDPALGHSGTGAYFGEENEAQLALARLGYLVRYVPDAAVWHLIPAGRMRRGSILRRRFAYGASLAARGGRPRAVAARQALSSAAGCLVAAAKRDERLVMVRAFRAAENAGVLAGPLGTRAR